MVPGRNPMLLAKELATLDRLSNGASSRPSGWAPDPGEHQAFGVERAERAKRFDEVVPLLRRFWAGEAVDHEGEFHRYEGAVVRPLPVQDPLEIWFGGSRRRAAGAAAPRRRLAAVLLHPGRRPAGIPAIQRSPPSTTGPIDPEHFGALIPYVDGEIPDVVKAGLPHPPARRGPRRGHRLRDGRPAADDRAPRGGGRLEVRRDPAGRAADWDDHLAEVAAALLPLQTWAASGSLARPADRSDSAPAGSAR